MWDEDVQDRKELDSRWFTVGLTKAEFFPVTKPLNKG